MYPVHTDPLHPDSQRVANDMLNLRPTAEIRQEIDEIFVKYLTADDEKERSRYQHHLGILDVELQDGQIRDRLEEGRPIGCWCLGLGGYDAEPTDVPLDPPATAVWKVTCTCPEGQEARQRTELAHSYAHR